MVLSEKKMMEIMKRYAEVFEDLAYYDETREKRWGRKRIDVTIDLKILRKLKEIKKKTGKPISRIIEDAVSKI